MTLNCPTCGTIYPEIDSFFEKYSNLLSQIKIEDIFDREWNGKEKHAKDTLHAASIFTLKDLKNFQHEKNILSIYMTLLHLRGCGKITTAYVINKIHYFFSTYNAKEVRAIT